MGDEPRYISKAEYFAKHGILPKADAGLEKSGWTDYRAPGYPVFIALCNWPKFDIGNIRLRCATVQFVLMSLALVCLYFIAVFSMKSSKWLYLAALILGIQPWAFEYSANLYAESLCASLTTICLVFLCLFVKTKKQGMEFVYIMVSGGFMLLACMMRTDMFFLAPPIAVLAIIVKLKTGRRALKHAVILGLTFFCLIGIQAGYRYYLTEKPGLIPKYKFSYQGVVNWTATWFNTEKSAIEGFAFGSAKKKMENLPPYAFGDDYEKKEIARAISLCNASGHTEEVDTVFQKIADKRIKDNFLANFVLIRIWRSANLWLNLETNAQLLNVLSDAPALIRKFILAGLLLLKISVFLLAIVSFFYAGKAHKGRDHAGLSLSNPAFFSAYIVNHSSYRAGPWIQRAQVCAQGLAGDALVRGKRDYGSIRYS